MEWYYRFEVRGKTRLSGFSTEYGDAEFALARYIYNLYNSWQMFSSARNIKYTIKYTKGFIAQPLRAKSSRWATFTPARAA
jgi:hypothetical protein